MDEFNHELFTSPTNYEEGILRERKSEVRYWTSQGKAEFIRNFIILANTARMLGKPAYLLLGIRDSLDESAQDICAIDEMYERQLQRGRNRTIAFEVIRRELSQIVRRYVEPRPIFEIRFDQVGKKVVGYIMIQPLTGRPFRAREFREGGNTHLYKGQCWIRSGESKDEISLQQLDPEDNRLCYCYAEVPCVLPSAWDKVLRCGARADIADLEKHNESSSGGGLPRIA
ncbi:MAG: hypothetical protein NZ840_03435 [Anaerolineales bacterium]|nr:hypothetical protein [Anaerolineales bacterium]MDW8161085.1 hypothetical protein [Anaerolineales bacterium]